ncbi:MAG: helix-turn-helix transcriptional regulator [Kordiimonadaceae bacterium]|jgi:DNA-binding HxlR family transcriptional regulator|nr:helix-turn-helix transcriptional regulator [Kordiimonadaceae bacterium]MBT6032051.1 helix-turn-helix transcriptional regulator [Kordiimonadaceae bacterium]
MKYGQFCPIAKATELLGEKWTLLIIRELLMGSSRFNELQRGLSMISPALLTKRLQSLEQTGLLIKKKISGQRGYEYFASEPTEQLLPILLDLGDWGMRWAKDNLTDEDYDVDFLMIYLRRSIVPDKLPGNETIIKFKFLDIDDNPNWWLIVKGEDIDICVKDPGKDVDVYFTSTVEILSKVWLGHLNYKDVIKSEELLVVGPRGLTRNISSWLKNSPFKKE